MGAGNVLVVTGEFDLVQRVKQVLDAHQFAIHAAYSYLDALYQLRYESFELVLVDAAMISHLSGELTASALSELDQHPPLLIYAPKNGASRWPQETVLPSLDEETLRRSVARVLRIPSLVPTEPPKAPPRIEGSSTSIFWRDDEMQTLFALSRSLTEVLDLSEVLNRVVEAARRLTDAEEGMILLPDGQSGQLYLRAKVGIDHEVADNFRVKTNDTIAGTVFQTGQPMLVAESGPHKVKTEYFVNALLYVPIIHKAQTLGVLGVNNKVKHDLFSERHRDLLINLATYAAVAIENARVHGQSIRRQHELKALIDASQVINASLSFEYTLPTICEQLAQVLNVGYAEVYQWDRDSKRMSVLARYQEARWRSGQQPVIDLADRPVLRLAVDTRRHYYVHRDRHDVPAEREEMLRMGALASLIIPLIGGDQVIGLLQAFYVVEPGAEPTLEMVYRAQRILLEGLANTSDEYSFRPLEDSLEILGANWVEFSLLTVDNSQLYVQLALGCGVWMNQTGPQIDLSAFPDLMEALEKQRPINDSLSNATQSLGVRALLRLTRGRALLTLPLIGRGKLQGLVLFADTLHAREFSAREVDLGRAIVGQAATALENANLLRDLEESLRELKETQNHLIQTARLSAMGELAAAVAHQINNPLTTIVLDTELLMEREGQDQDVLNAISRAGKRAAAVVRRLLAMAHPNSAASPPVPIDVKYTIEEVVTLVRPYIVRAGIQINCHFPETPLPPVQAVVGELDDVWLNLILNAHDALAGRRSPEINVIINDEPENHIIEVVVADNGPGIPDEVAREIFKPFFTTKPLGEGTGLGLHICRQVLDHVGGTISLKTSNEGARFIVRVPTIRST